jgi:hypothetical protein
MKLFEIIGLKENTSSVSTVSGSIATVPTSMGMIQRRIPGSMFLTKYTNDPTPNTPAEYKKYKRKK